MIIANRILRIGTSPATGLHYTKEALLEMVQRWEERSKQSSLPITWVMVNPQDVQPNFVDLEQVGAYVKNMFVDDEGLVVEMEVLETTSSGSTLAINASDGIRSITPNVVGVVEDSNVKNAQISSISIITGKDK